LTEHTKFEIFKDKVNKTSEDIIDAVRNLSQKIKRRNKRKKYPKK